MGGGERLRAGGGELDRERERVQAGAERGDLLARPDLRALAEEGDGLGLGEGWHRVLDLALHTQELAARNDQGQVGAGEEEAGELGRRLDHLLQVVEEQEHLPLTDVLGKTVPGPERLGDRLCDKGWVAQGGEPDPEDARLVLRNECGSRLESKPGLARAAGAGKGQKPRSLLDAGEDVCELCLSADEGGRRTREVRVRDRLERRKGAPPLAGRSGRPPGRP